MSVCAAPLKLSAGITHAQNLQRPKIMSVCPASVQIEEKDAMFCWYLVLLNSKDCEYIKPFCHFFFSNYCTKEQCLFFCLVSKQALLPAMFKMTPSHHYVCCVRLRSKELEGTTCLAPILSAQDKCDTANVSTISFSQIHKLSCHVCSFSASA